jgi:hypothetical protein
MAAHRYLQGGARRKMPPLYITLAKKNSKHRHNVNGSFLSKNNDELERIAKRLGVVPLMEFFGISNDSLKSTMPV